VAWVRTVEVREQQPFAFAVRERRAWEGTRQGTGQGQVWGWQAQRDPSSTSTAVITTITTTSIVPSIVPVYAVPPRSGQPYLFFLLLLLRLRPPELRPLLVATYVLCTRTLRTAYTTSTSTVWGTTSITLVLASDIGACVAACVDACVNACVDARAGCVDTWEI
jgi:hypothetical protein